MTRMLLVADVNESIKKHQAHIISSLKDPDISIRRRSLDLLYGMCDISNAKDIVEELLQYLTTADFGIREELALKAAILAEKFAPNLAWYGHFLLPKVSEYLFTEEIEAKLLCQLDSVLRTTRTSISNVFLRTSMQLYCDLTILLSSSFWGKMLLSGMWKLYYS
jgi:hypothetical protein